MELSDLISADDVIAKLKASSKKQVLQEMAVHGARLTKLPERAVLDGLLERERLGSTGVGHGVAIPHAKFANLDRLYGLFARLETAIDFESIDDQPVDLVFVLLAPEDAGAEHLKALARVSRLFRNADICAKLRASSDPAALYALLTEPASTASV